MGICDVANIDGGSPACHLAPSSVSFSSDPAICSGASRLEDRGAYPKNEARVTGCARQP
jgi:hypothetical protein